MNTSAKLDIGPLTWVKGEIDLALSRASEALGQHDAGASDAPHLKAARAHLHQAHGALSIVGLDGVTRFSEALERLLDAVEEGKVPFQPVAADMAHRGITAIQHYLEDLIAGRPDQPLRLLPVYRAVTEAAGLPAPSPTDLFFPDLTLRPPRREHEPLPIEAADFVPRAKSARLKYERGLLKWLKNDPRGAAEMRDALTAIEATQSQPAARAYWWTALAFLDVLAARTMENDFGTRRVCARIDIQIKRLIEGSRSVAERLMRDTLYYIAIGGPASDHAECVRSVFQLGELIPSAQDSADIEPLRPVLRGCREQIAPAMDDWNRFCAGTAAALPQFNDRVRQLAESVAPLQNADFSRLAQAILTTADELRRAPLAHNEALALEMATALLLTDHALEHFQLLDAEFPDQVTTITKRLDAALHAQALASMEIPQLDEMSRQAQEKLLLAQVVREIQSNLGHIEQTLDAFFRDPGRAGELYGLAKPIRQVEGALTVLGQERAVKVLRECEASIEGFSQPSDQPQQQAFEEVADKLSALGFFVEQLQHGPADIDQYLRPPSAAPAEPKEITPEVELERAKRLTKTLVGALRSKPEDQTLRGEIRHSLEVVRENAELVDDTALAEQASAAIVAIESEQPSSEIADAIAQLAPVDLPAMPSAEATRLADASSEEIDAELLGIFIEEAHDVLAMIGNELPKLTAQPHDRETLTTIRRGFHTLKGSGRMVGLSELGEAAWAVEQVLNRWLQQDLEATPGLLAMLRQAHELFGNWVVKLESGGGIHHDATALVDACEALKVEAPALPALPVSQQTPVETPTPVNEVTPEVETIEAFEAIPEPEPIEPVVPEIEVRDIPEGASPVPEEVAEAAPEPKPVGDSKPVGVESAAPVLRLVTSPELEPEPEGVQLGDLLLSPALYDLYVREARDYIVTLIHELGIGGRPRAALVRAAHTLAGISATADIAPVQRLAHSLEMALNRLDTVGAAPTEAQHLLLARAVGALEGMVGAVANRRMPQNEDGLAADLDLLSPEVLAPTPAVMSPMEPPADNKIVEAGSPPAETAVKEIAPHEEHAERRQLHLPDELDDQLLPIFLDEATDLMRDIGTGLRNWREQPGDHAIAERLQRALHTLKGSARMAGAMSIGELVHSMETRIEQAVASNAPTPVFLDTLDSSFDRVSLLMDRIQAGPATADEPVIPALDQPQAVSATGIATPTTTTLPVEPARPEPQDSEAAARNMLRVRADIVDKLVNEAGEIAIARGRIEGEMRSLKGALLDLTENVIRLRNQLREIEIQAELQMQSREAAAAEKERQFDPLEFDRFTRFQELTRMMAESVNDVATSQQSLLQNLDHADAALIAQSRLNREHSQALMNVRMVPFNALADRLYRIVRQTAKELDKRANLDIRGGQTELDRSVLEKMTGPIEHLLRNAVAHGLESSSERRAAGKSDIGEISLRVGQEGNEVVIELSDDGHGLDFERIRARGIANGLLAADDNSTPDTLSQLIFQPGFSTAETVTSIAGRGIGMDVVRNEAASLGGRIRVDSAAGKGARFQIYLPLTLAVTQAVLVKSGGRHYAIPSSMIAQVREMKPEAIAAVRAEGATTWLGQNYPWHYLPRMLGTPAAQPEPARRHWLLLLRAGDQRAAVEVDGLVGNQELVVKNVGPQLARIVGIAGATVLGDGEIVLILNPVALAGRNVATAASQAQATEAPPPEPAATTVASTGVVMVVDDSLTVRKITSRLLSREGYHVLLAKDGVDALEQLIDMVPDVMLVDIEMPRMDGFDLTRNVRADERLKNIPIIMITSRIADKHRNYAKEIGVNNYLGKPYDEDELLDLIAGYTHKDA